jgi:hypothetical protein
MVEVKADALEESFEALERDENGVAALKAELLSGLSRRLATVRGFIGGRAAGEPHKR